MKLNIFAPPCAAIIVSTMILGYLVGYRGPGLSVDSVHYLSAADSFLAQGKFLQVDGVTPATMWPPGFPLLLAGLKATGISFALLQTLIFAGYLYLLYAYLRAKNTSQTVLLLAISLAGFSYAHLNVFRMLWSESAFMLLQLLTMFCIYNYLRWPRANWLLLAAAAAGFSPIFRYIGITSILFGFFALMLNKKIRQAIIFGCLATLPLAGLFIFNRLTYGASTGHDTVQEMSGLEYSLQTVDRLGKYFLPAPGIVFFVLTAVALGFYGREKLKKFFWEYHLELLYTAIYCGFLIVSSLIVHIEPPGVRYLDPIYIYMLIPLLGFLARQNYSKYFLAFLILHSVFQFYEKAKQTYHKGAGFNQEQFRQSETLEWVRQNPPPNLFSNMGELIYFYAKQRPDFSGDDCSELIKKTKSEVTYVWFKESPRPACSPRHLKNYLAVTGIKEFSDAEIVVLSPKH